MLVLAGCLSPPRHTTPETGNWGAAQNGLRTQLREIPNDYARGYLKLLALTMENVSAKPLQYDDQQAACNDFLIVRYNGIELVPFRGELVMTEGEPKTIAPDNIVPLFYNLILEESYDISRPGLYTIQFRGRSGDANNAPLPASNVITIRMK